MCGVEKKCLKQMAMATESERERERVCIPYVGSSTGQHEHANSEDNEDDFHWSVKTKTCPHHGY